MCRTNNEEVEHFRWPWCRSYGFIDNPQHDIIKKTVKDSLTGQEHVIEVRRLVIPVVEYEQMKADQCWGKILGTTLLIMAIAGIIGISLSAYYRYKKI